MSAARTRPTEVEKVLLTFVQQSFESLLNYLQPYFLARQNVDGYQTILNFKNLEYCAMLKNIATSPIPFVENFFKYLKSGKAFGGGNIMDLCEMDSGEVNFFNATLENFPAMDFFPAGKIF